MKVEFCPDCGSSKVMTNLLGTESACSSCSWKGEPKQLLAHSISANLEAIAARVSADYLIALSQMAAPAIGKAMVVSGVVGGKEPKEVLARIIRATTLAAHKATLLEIDAIQKEKRDVNTTVV
jgi:hypothetical protein